MTETVKGYTRLIPTELFQVQEYLRTGMGAMTLWKQPKEPILGHLLFQAESYEVLEETPDHYEVGQFTLTGILPTGEQSEVSKWADQLNLPILEVALEIPEKQTLFRGYARVAVESDGTVIQGSWFGNETAVEGSTVLDYAAKDLQDAGKSLPSWKSTTLVSLANSRVWLSTLAWGTVWEYSHQYHSTGRLADGVILTPGREALVEAVSQRYGLPIINLQEEK